MTGPLTPSTGWTVPGAPSARTEPPHPENERDRPRRSWTPLRTRQWHDIHARPYDIRLPGLGPAAGWR
ncbi:hypothetical protein ACFYUJ_26530 [Streptomyces sp. NPDC004520]|uniref:hypothetical protein n=1 Tax=Streptomyces sp. NPDC004520 TaxID=3364702 RepID=UPI0036991005